MTEQSLDPQRLNVYRLSIDDANRSFEGRQSLGELHRQARHPWLRAAQAFPLNIAEGNGKRSLKDRARFLEFAFGSGLECAAIQEVLVTTKAIEVQDDAGIEAMLYRIVAMLTWIALKSDSVAESAHSTMLASNTSTSAAKMTTSENPRPKKRQNHGMQESGGDEVSDGINADSRRPLIPEDNPSVRWQNRKGSHRKRTATTLTRTNGSREDVALGRGSARQA